MHDCPRFSGTGHCLKNIIKMSAESHLNCEKILFQLHVVVGLLAEVNSSWAVRLSISFLLLARSCPQLLVS